MNTRNFYLALVVVFSTFQSLVAQSTYFVNASVDGGSNRGSSWVNAAKDLQIVLAKAVAGDQIWVAEGMYFPTAGKDRSVAFEIPEGVQIIGGFAGKEKLLNERQSSLHPTVLSGNIGSQDADDNSYNVVVLHNSSEKTILDGFIITNGRADGNTEAGTRFRSGGGLFVDASKNNAAIVRNCVFIDNFAKDGGAIYVNARNGGKATPTFKSCSFDSNAADLDGGAVNLDGRAQGQNNPSFIACSFDNNKGNYGGGVFSYALNGDATATMTNCRFSANSAYVKGGAMFQLTSTMVGEVDLKTVAFSNNVALDHETDDFTHYAVTTNEFASK